jgi:hypothetical protein
MSINNRTLLVAVAVPVSFAERRVVLQAYAVVLHLADLNLSLASFLRRKLDPNPGALWRKPNVQLVRR